MMWESISMMTGIDIAIVGAVGYSLWVFYHQIRNLPRSTISFGVSALVLGLSSIALFYLFDLATMHVLPLFMPMSKAMAIMEEIEGRTRGTLNLCNDTSLAAIAELGRRATIAVGNDTGPMHLIAAAGCPSVVLFSEASVPEQTAPRGETVVVVQHERLPSLGIAAVLRAVYQAVPHLRPAAQDSDSSPAQTKAG